LCPAAARTALIASPISPRQVVPFEQPVRLRVPDHRLDGAAPPQLSSDRRQGNAAGMSDEDVQPLTHELVPAATSVDVSVPYPAAGQTIIRDLPRVATN